MHAALVLNRAAGSLNGERGAVAPEEVRDALAATGLTVDLHVAPPGRLMETLSTVMSLNRRQHLDAVFVGGGDGTISTAAGRLEGTGIALGVLPLGTLNHFARDLGIPTDWRDAVATLAQGVTAAVDLGEVNGRPFINNCSLGAYAEAVRKRDSLRLQRGSGKRWAMILASLAVFRRLRRVRVTIETDGRAQALRTPFVVVSNNRYSGRVLNESLRPRLDQGQLALYTTRAHRHLALVRMVWQSLMRNLDSADELEVSSARSITLSCATPYRPPLAIDGELVDLRPPFIFRSRPRALHVLVPPATAEHHEDHRPSLRPAFRH